MRKAELLDAQEDGKYGKGKLGSDLPKELQRRQDRLEKIRQARKALEAEAAAASRDRAKQAAAAEAAAADAAEAEADASEQQKLRKKADRSRQKAETAKNLAIEKAREAGLEPEGLEPQAADAMPQRGLAHRADGSPKASAQRNFTDPDSHIMKSDGNLLQGYNCQAAVDGDHQVIVAMGVSNQSPDPEHLVPMLERTIANTGACPETLIADTGYWSEDNVSACEERGADPHISTGRQKHGQPPPPICGPIPKGLDAIAEGFCVGGAFSKRSSRQDGPQAAQEGRQGDLRQAQDDRGAGVWSNQRSARAAAVSIARAGEGEQ
jgi:hypothetical protein